MSTATVQATDDDHAIDTRTAARLLGLSTWGLAEMRRAGGGPPYFRLGRRGRMVRYRLGDVRAWIAAHTVAQP